MGASYGGAKTPTNRTLEAWNRSRIRSPPPPRARRRRRPRSAARPARSAAAPPVLSGPIGLLPKHEVGARVAGSGERGRARSSGTAAPASLTSPFAPVSSLPTKWLRAGRHLRQPPQGALLPQWLHLQQARPAHHTTGVCVDDEGVNAQEVHSLLIRVRCGVFKKEIGELPQTVFAEFDPVPLASASLAQVHASTSHDGKKVAVKVQHNHLMDTSVIDIAIVDLVVNALHYIFPTFDYRDYRWDSRQHCRYVTAGHHDHFPHISFLCYEDMKGNLVQAIPQFYIRMLEATSEERSMRESGPNSTSLSPNKVLGTIERDQPYSSSGDEHGEDWVAFLPS